jgi:PAS domain S-box-containing protein
LSLKDEIEVLVKQNETLIHTLGLMGMRLEVSLQMLSAISSLTAVPVKAGSVTEAAHEILETIVLELSDIEACSILLYNSDRNSLDLLAAKGQADLLGIKEGPYNQDLSFAPGEGVAGRVFVDNAPLFWDRLMAEPELLKEAVGLTSPESLACLPLCSPERRMGVLNVSFGQIRPFDPPRKRSLILLSLVVTNLIQTFMLKSELNQKAADLLRAREDLERRVDDRTVRLLAATEALKDKIVAQDLAEGALKESEDRYRSLVERTSDGFFMFEIPEGCFVFVNRRVCDLLGYTEEEALRLKVWQVIADQDLERVRRLLDTSRLDQAGATDRVVVSVVRRDGTMFNAECSTSLVSFRGRPVIQGVLRDVTEQERTRQQLVQAQKMEALGTLAGGIAHDFNNILSAMMGYTELVQNKIPKGTKARRNLDQILKAGLRARDLVKQILAFSRQTESEKKPLLLRPIVKETLRLMRASLPSTIEIQRHIHVDEATVMADATEIHQIVMNLVTNAGQALRDHGGKIEVSLDEVMVTPTDRVDLGGLKPGLYARLTVADNGLGMEPEVMARIFEPYFTTRQKNEGTGLGLAVVHGIVKSYGGAVTVSSVPGKGSVFTVYLPCVEAAAEGDEDEDLTPLLKGTERLLFVDDEEALIDVGRQVLERLGYRVTADTSSLRAYDLFVKEPHDFDLVITDQTMPEMTGAELAKKILEIRPDMPIILCTGFSDKIFPEQALAAGVKRFVYKPLVVREMAENIRGLLDRGCYPERAGHPENGS